MDIFERVKKFNLPLGQYAVFGSSLLDVWGIRKAHDLDIIVMPELFDKLKMEGGWKDDSGDGYDLLTKEDADVTTTQDQPTTGLGNYCPDRIQLIKDAVIIKGVPFVRIEEVLACKKDYDREKDHIDIALIEDYINKHGDKDLYKIDKRSRSRFFVMKTPWFKRKTYGWGWYPATWQGWLVLVVFIILIILNSRQADFIWDTVFMTGTLIAICYLTGESPRWQWGGKRQSTARDKRSAPKSQRRSQEQDYEFVPDQVGDC